MMQEAKIFNSNEYNEKHYQLATGHISTTVIVFEVENVVVTIEAKGDINISDRNGKLLSEGSLPRETEGKGTYNSVTCRVADGVITLAFPIVEWIDNYPHCDGEHDRWDTRTVGHHTVNWDTKTNAVTYG